jgi:hypothetical protein
VRINQNISAFNAYRNLSQTNTVMGKSLEKLSSGFRINRAADDASGLVRSEGLRAEIGGTKVAIRNAQDGISFVQTAEGALEEVHAILQRMRDLAVSASNATSDGVAENAEFQQLVEELGAIGARTTFAGVQVFDGEDRVFQVGAYDEQTIEVSFDEIDVELVSGYPRGLYDLMIELYDSDTGLLLDEFGPAHSSAFSLLPLEDIHSDSVPRVTHSRGRGGAGTTSWILLIVMGALALARSRLRRIAPQPRRRAKAG